MKTALVTVVTGEIYEKFAEDLFVSADQFFQPTKEVEFLMLPGTPGWPAATMYRWHHLADHMPDADYVFLCDADMLFVADVGTEILSHDSPIVVQHPGYVGMPEINLPYERRDDLACAVGYGDGEFYFAGGFVGGSDIVMKLLASEIADAISSDVKYGAIPVWHDESALNMAMTYFWPPGMLLTPSYCYPEDDTWYQTIWKQPYERKLVALDKSPEQRSGR